MKLLTSFLDLFRVSSVSPAYDSQKNRVLNHRQVALNKPEFLQIVSSIQKQMVDFTDYHFNPSGRYVELGAGALPMNLNFPRIRSTDVVETDHLDGVLDATDMNVEDQSLDAIFLQNTFHHIPDPVAFFSECIRVLKQNGRIVVLDPYFNLISRTIYPILFSSETFDRKGTWFDATDHAMNGANQALSYIVFVRDENRFNESFPNLQIREKLPLSEGLRYLLSGGLNFKRIAPKFTFHILESMENLGLIRSTFSLHWIVVIEKTQ